MKKLSWICLTALLLSCILVLNACSFGDTIRLSKLYDESAFRTPSAPTSARLITELDGAEYDGYYWEYYTLMLFTKEEGDYTTYEVYNIESNKIVLSKTESETVKYNITVEESYNTVSSFIAVVSTNYATKDGEVDYTDYTLTTTLYNANGTQIVSAEGAEEYSASCDLLYFNGKVYRWNGNDQYKYAFDYSPLAVFPRIGFASGKYYIVVDDECISAYNQKLELVGTYILPSYLLDEEKVIAIPLEDGKLFFQAWLELNDQETEYDILKDGYKYDTVTLIIDIPDGTDEEIEFVYNIEDMVYMADEIYGFNDYGLNKNIKNLIIVNPIEHHRIDANTCQLATMKGNGELQFLEQFEGMNIESVEILAEDRLLIETNLGSYLADADFNLIADISNANLIGGHLMSGDKVYDYNLNVVVNCQKEKLEELDYNFESAILFEGEEDELVLVNKGKRITLIEKNAENIELVGVKYGYIIICDDTADETKYKIYSEEGKLLLTLDYNPEFTLVLSGENAQLIQISYYDISQNKTVERYYIFK